jgi:5'-nucleotidase
MNWKQVLMTRDSVFKMAAILLLALFPATPVMGASGPSTLKAKTLKIQILAINDFHGQITEGRYVLGRPVGSAPVLASYLKTAAKGMENKTFIVHAGDFVGASTPESSLLQDEPTIEFMNLLGNKHCTDKFQLHPKCNLVGTVGNHEFDEGVTEMMRLFEGGNHVDGPFLQDPWNGAAFPHVCANVVDEDTRRPLLPPFAIKQVKGMPVAFIGAVLEGTPSIVTASGIAGYDFIDEAQAINKQVARLKRRGIKTIVVLIHQGGRQGSYSGPTDPSGGEVTGDIVEIVKAMDSEVDVVVTGHWHGFTNALMTNDQGAEILVTQAWSKGSAYADIDLEIDLRSRNVVSKSAQIITTWADQGPGLTPDPDVAGLVERAKAATEPLTSRYIAEAAIEITKTQNAAGESALGNLIADAQRATMGTDFAFMNPGGIRADLDAGDVTWGELYTIQPFNNYLIKMELTGQQIYDLLNQQYEPYQPYDRILQVSGLTYTWDADRPSDDRIVEIRKDGAAIDPNAVYTVTVNSFIADGGDNFSVLPQGTHREVGPIDLDALIDYIQKLDQPFSSAIENRIERLNE